MQAVFAAQIPGADFEQRIIAGLRHRWTPRLVIHPMVRRAAAGVAAVLVLGVLGSAANRWIEGGGLPMVRIGNGGIGTELFGVGGPSKVGGQQPALIQDPRVLAVLDKPLPEVKLEAAQLGDVIDFLRDISGANIYVNWKALEAARVDRQSPVTLRLRDVRFGTVLDKVVEQVSSKTKLAYAANDGVITVSTADDCARVVQNAVNDRVVLADARMRGPGIASTAGNYAEEKKIPYDDIYRYPANWSDISSSRVKAGDQVTNRASESLVLDKKASDRAISELIRDTRTHIAHDDSTKGLATLDQILRLDPVNSYALSVRPLVEERAIMSQQRESRERFNVELRKQINQAEEKVGAIREADARPGNVVATNGKSFNIGGGVSPANREITLKQATATAGMSDSLTVPSSIQPSAMAKPQSELALVEGSSFRPADFAAGHTLLLGGLTITGESSSEAGVPIPRRSVERTVNSTQVAIATPAAPGNPQPSAEPAPKPQVAQAVHAPAEQAADAAAGRKIIRNGQMEFEVESFDSAFTQISKIVLEERGFVASTESEKLTNGKMTGTVVLRVAPEHLDTLVLKLRALGDLKNQKIVAQDITRQYTDLESQLRAARAMEQRLLEIIKTGNGEIKDLVAAEKELGVWREKIEQVEGEIRYCASQVALSTLKITLSEKDVKAAAFASETELRSIGIETEDVEKSYTTAQELVSEFKGRIVGATLKKLDAGQFAASIICDVAPENAGPMTDRLKQLGKVARLEAERKTTTDGTEAPVSAKVQRKDARFIISLYNLANIAPRETTSVNLACRNVDAAYRAILLRVAKAGGRIVGSNLNQLKADQTTATISFQVKTEDADALLAELRKPGDAADTEVTRLSTTENTDTANVTTAKRGFAVQIVSLASVAPRETITLQLTVPSVPVAYKAFASLLGDEAMQSRILSSQLSERDRQNVTGSLDFEVRRSDLPAIDKALAGTGEVFSRSATRATDAENTIDSKVRITVAMISAENLAPREVATMGIEVANVEKTMGDIAAAAVSLKGRSVESRLSKEPSGRITGRLVIDIPLAKAAEILTTVREQGTVRTVDTARNTQVPDGALARTRLEITISNGEGIVAGDQGVWATVRHGLATSVAGLLWSLQLIVIGLFMVGPWVLLIWGGWRLARRGKRKSASPGA